MPTLRVLLDTSVLVSGLAYSASAPGTIIAAWRHGSIEVLLSAYILDELRRVLPRLAHRHGLSTVEIVDLVDVLSIQAKLIEPLQAQDAALRDPDDGPVLGSLVAALAVADVDYLITADVDYLITSDKDLLQLADRYPIVDPATFWAKHGGV
jgi:putative PIN family toxin of toxin-antitoxin system